MRCSDAAPQARSRFWIAAVERPDSSGASKDEATEPRVTRNQQQDSVASAESVYTGRQHVCGCHTPAVAGRELSQRARSRSVVALLQVPARQGTRGGQGSAQPASILRAKASIARPLNRSFEWVRMQSILLMFDCLVNFSVNLARDPQIFL